MRWHGRDRGPGWWKRNGAGDRFNGTKEAVEAIKAGKLLATGDYHGYNQGCLSVMAALRYLRKQPVPKEILLPVLLIDKSNYHRMTSAPEQRSCPKWDEVVNSSGEDSAREGIHGYATCLPGPRAVLRDAREYHDPLLRIAVGAFLIPHGAQKLFRLVRRRAHR